MDAPAGCVGLRSRHGLSLYKTFARVKLLPKTARLMLFFALLASAGPALAGEPFYFHKTGVSGEQYMDEVNDCAQLAGGVRVPHMVASAYGGTPANNALAAGLPSFFIAVAEQTAPQTAEEAAVPFEN